MAHPTSGEFFEELYVVRSDDECWLVEDPARQTPHEVVAIYQLKEVKSGSEIDSIVARDGYGFGFIAAAFAKAQEIDEVKGKKE